ncbi:hypothetical protein [Pseudoalteromonas ostreae]|uniref:hypothetical protein n=1 Tax=Pseudoalteromonas ostreae TaxID=2774154 RepID=UPI001B3879F8|nr:hypothetical protein [Pseudoalteromonas ostreae]
MAQKLLEVLAERTVSGDTGYISLDLICQQLNANYISIEIDELKLTAKFLAQDSEFFYDIENGQTNSTRKLTKLLDYQIRSERVRLTTASRLLYRVTSYFKDWMFEDKEVEKIVRAIKTREFHRIPSLVESNVVMFRSLNEEITRMYESSDYDELTESYLNRRRVYQETLSLSQEAARAAILMLSSDEARADIEHLQNTNPETEVTTRRLLAHINELIAAIEALSRNFSQLINILQKPRDYRLGVIDFSSQAANFAKSTISEEVLLDWTNSHFGWQLPHHIHSVIDFSGALVLPNRDDTPKVISVDFDDGNDPIFTWVEQNHKELLTHLESGPKQLHWLINHFNHFNQNQNLSEMDDIYDLFTTSFDEQKLVEDITVRVNSDCQHSLTLANGSKILLSDVTLSIGNII